MTLTVETGAGIANADSYETLANTRTYATSRGATLSTDDATVETQIRTAFDTLNGYGDRYKGTKHSATQSGQWPRDNARIDGFDLDSDAIPKQLKQAQNELVIAQSNGTDLSPIGDTARILEEQVGPIRTRYSETVGAAAGVAPSIPVVDDLLRPLLRSGALGGFVTVRV